MELQEYLDAQPKETQVAFVARTGISQSVIQRICAGKFRAATPAWIIERIRTATKGLVNLHDLHPGPPQAPETAQDAS